MKERPDALNNLHMKITHIKLPEFLLLVIHPAYESAYTELEIQIS